MKNKDQLEYLLIIVVYIILEISLITERSIGFGKGHISYDADPAFYIFYIIILVGIIVASLMHILKGDLYKKIMKVFLALSLIYASTLFILWFFQDN